MDKLVLYVGNKNYSSWSLRPWLALEAAGITFEDVVIPFDFAAGNPKLKEISPTGRVPLLIHGDTKIWESLAIIDYVAELFPEAGLWPADQKDRARARSYACEMLSGFRALRSACPMNIRRKKEVLDVSDGCAPTLPASRPSGPKRLRAPAGRSCSARLRLSMRCTHLWLTASTSTISFAIPRLWGISSG